MNLHSSEPNELPDRPNPFLAASRGSTYRSSESSFKSSSMSHAGDGSRGCGGPEDVVGRGLSRSGPMSHTGLGLRRAGSFPFPLPLTAICTGPESNIAFEPEAALGSATSRTFSPLDVDTTSSPAPRGTCEPTENIALVARFRNGLSNASLMRRTFTGPKPGKVWRRSDGARAMSAKLCPSN
jgi:hypothetical protein